jgi:hypothetical protein
MARYGNIPTPPQGRSKARTEPGVPPAPQLLPPRYAPPALMRATAVPAGPVSPAEGGGHSTALCLPESFASRPDFD